jgi:hypothetical protein
MLLHFIERETFAKNGRFASVNYAVFQLGFHEID